MVVGYTFPRIPLKIFPTQLPDGVRGGLEFIPIKLQMFTASSESGIMV